MEINANIYIIADSQELMEKTEAILSRQTEALFVWNTVISIGKEAFMHCGSLRRITIPEGVEKIGESALQGCSKLEKVLIPKSIKCIGQNAFRGCKIVPEGMRDAED